MATINLRIKDTSREYFFFGDDILTYPDWTAVETLDLSDPIKGNLLTALDHEWIEGDIPLSEIVDILFPPSSGGGSSAWGDITGILSNQVDLQGELDGKVDNAQVLTDVPAGAVFTDTTYDDEISRIEEIATDRNEPSGFIRESEETMGVLEMFDGTNMHRIWHDGLYENMGPITTFYDGSAGAVQGEFSISPLKIADGGDDTFSVYVDGRKLILSSSRREVIDLSTSGLKFIAFTETGDLLSTSVFNFDFFEDVPIISVFYYDKPNDDIFLFGDERHGISMSGAEHRYHHFTDGARYVSGFTLEGLSNGANSFTRLTAGQMYDEDLIVDIGEITEAPFLWREWDIVEGKNVWRSNTPSNNLSLLDSDVGLGTNGDSVFNESVNGESQLTTITDGNGCVIIFFMSTNNKIDPVYKIVGQKEYNSPNSARNDVESAYLDLVLNGLPSPEFTPLAAVIMERDNILKLLSDGSTHIDLRTHPAIGAGASAPNTNILIVESKAIDTYLLLGDAEKYLRIDSLTPGSITVDTSISTLPIGTQFHIRQVGDGQVTLVEDGTIINTPETLLLSRDGSTVTLVKVNTNEYDVFGSLELL